MLSYHTAIAEYSTVKSAQRLGARLSIRVSGAFQGIRAEPEFVAESQEGLTHNCRNRLQLDRIVTKSLAIPYL